ncbi:DUF2281 domain-containing protein [candidate division WOR-3 bacterium]|nr:DUF2281 domain-containing protein [candidate division WOR-3 bacterium]
MTKRESILKELDRVPDSVLDEVTDFIRFLQARIARDGITTAVASESSLKKDWLRPEEDEAWQDL